MRLYITGTIAVEQPPVVISETSFPGRQARLLFACLACERSRAVPREELAEVVWPEEVPTVWESAMKALVSKPRHALVPLSSAPLIEFSSDATSFDFLPILGWTGKRPDGG